MKFDKGVDSSEIQELSNKVEKEVVEVRKKSKAELYLDKEDLELEGVSTFGEEPKTEDNEIDDKVDSIIEEAGSAQINTKTRLRKEKVKEYEEIKATEDLIFTRKDKKIPLKIPVSDTEAMVFMAKRLSEREMQKYFDRKLMTKNQDDLSDEEVELLREKNYELLAKVIVDPKMSSEKWADVDAPLSNELGIKVASLLSNINETKLLEDFKKK